MARKRFLTPDEDRAHQRVYSSAEWKRNRIAALKRAGYKCEECGNTDRCLEVHHTTPPWHGGTHELANLQVLCCSHHKLAHRELEKRGFP